MADQLDHRGLSLSICGGAPKAGATIVISQYIEEDAMKGPVFGDWTFLVSYSMIALLEKFDLAYPHQVEAQTLAALHDLLPNWPQTITSA